MEGKLKKKVDEIGEEIQFSGSVFVKGSEDTLLQESYGYANRSEKINNTNQTRFGIASGCKLFTAIAICQLVEAGKLSFATKLQDCLKESFPKFSKEITVHHLLTHTSGVPDYFDEEEMDDFEELWVKYPMYQIRRLQDFLPMFQNEPMKFQPGEKFYYNNAGYILLGLIVEEASGQPFTTYVEENIFKKAGMTASGYFEMDKLPEKTALGYIDLPNGEWKSNIYSLPVKGGSDGGAFVTAEGMVKLWEALLKYELLSEASTKELLSAHVQAEDEDEYYGYGVWMDKKAGRISKYHVMGYDPGVSFHSVYYPENSFILAICSNESAGAYDVLFGIEEIIID
ncbi:serine hydrolase domain-containing protein [Oceanobacillus sp. CAU 1775]